MAELNMSLFPQYKSPASAQAEGFSYAQAIQEAAQKTQARQAQQQAGDQYANGDRTAAAATLARSGNIAGAQGIEKGQQDAATKGQAYIDQSIPVFKAVAAKHAQDPDGGAQARAQAFDEIATEAQEQTGLNPQQWAQIKQIWVNDPGTFIAKLEGRQPVKYQTVGRDIVRQQGDTATPIYHGQAEAPSGYELGPDGHTLQPRAGGPADPKVVHALGLDKREIVVNNPVPQQGVGPGGVGVGKTIDERMISTLLKGDPASPEYAAAFSYLSKPRLSINPDTGQPVTITQDISWARPPVGRSAPQPHVNVGGRILPPHLSAEQKLAAGFADRMQQAESDVAAVEMQGTKAGPNVVSKIPIFGNMMVSEGFQKFDQARRNWINAQLRRESGAAISEGEFANANRQYFAVPGDSPAVIAQKQRNRKTAEAAMARSAASQVAAVTGAAPQDDTDALLAKYGVK